MTDADRCAICGKVIPEGIQVCPICNSIRYDMKTEQTARVMTLEDVDTAEACMEPVFVEMLDENGKPGETPDIFSWRFVKHIMPLTDGKIYVLSNVGFSSALYEETYNITWRCWTQRPTFKQREATPWEVNTYD